MSSVLAQKNSNKSSKSFNKRVGNFGEDCAVKILERKGFTVITRNYSVPQAEIDIIASKGDTLYFVEVKTRKNTIYGYPEEAVTRGKLKKILFAGQFFLQKNKLKYKKFGVAVVSLLILDGKIVREKVIVFNEV